MYNPSRRNRNIGTTKQGHGQNNKMVIPYSFETGKVFYERLENYEKTIETVKGHTFVFIIEETRKSSKHACSVRDIVTILEEIPHEDYGNLKYIILRQPKRKEETLSPTWGRLIYSYEFEKDYYPAIILDAVDYERKFKWKKNLSIDNQKELARLKEDGHIIVDTGKLYEADYDLDAVRNTQLYRTFLHELGHYVQYLEFVERPASEEEDFEIWEKRHDNYFKIPNIEREQFAHNYADKKRQELKTKKVIPFERR